MAADDLAEFVADGAEKVLVGVEDGAVQGEVDDRLRFVDRLDLTFEFGAVALLGGDVGGEFDDADDFVAVVDRVVGRLNPDVMPSFATRRNSADL